MKTRTNIRTEYTIHGLTSKGAWRPVTLLRFASEAAAEKALEEYKKSCAMNYSIFKDCKEYKIMKRTVVTTISEWEGIGE